MLEQIGYAILAGVLAGIAAACVVVVAGRHGHVEGPWLQVQEVRWRVGVGHARVPDPTGDG